MAAPGSGGRLVAMPLARHAGVALQLQQRDLWRLELYLALVALAITVAAVRVLLAIARTRRAFALLVMAAPAAGFALAGTQAALRLAETLPAALEGRDVVVTGVVANLPQQGRAGCAFASRSIRASRLPACRPFALSAGTPASTRTRHWCSLAWRCVPGSAGV